jgi:type IV secretion system protein VirB10
VPGGSSGNINDQNMQARLRSNMLVLNAAPPPADAQAQAADNALSQNDPNSSFARNAVRASAADKATATKLTRLSSTIAQGKIIDAVMETAINTDLPGPLRAIVSRDIYAESGRDIMIPKGSRLIGTYNSSVTRGQVRVLVIWTRLIRPDGLDIAIGSPGIDALGRAGVEGIADNKFTEIFTGAFLTSVVSIGVGLAADAVDDTQSTTTTGSNGTTSTSTAGNDAVRGGVATMGAASQRIVDSLINTKPTITVDQGTRVNVFVNRDLEFPSDGSNSIFVQ